jgi:hypothetical protein
VAHLVGQEDEPIYLGERSHLAGAGIATVNHQLLSPLNHSGYGFYDQFSHKKDLNDLITEFGSLFYLNFLSNEANNASITNASLEFNYAAYFPLQQKLLQSDIALGGNYRMGINTLMKPSNQNNPFAYLFKGAMEFMVLARYRFEITQYIPITVTNKLYVPFMGVLSSLVYASGIPPDLFEDEGDAENVFQRLTLLSYRGFTNELTMDFKLGWAKRPGKNTWRITYLFRGEYLVEPIEYRYAHHALLIGRVIKVYAP